jgi:hypothetical protein
MATNEKCGFQRHQMTTAPDSERLSGSGLLSRHSLASGSKHSTSEMVILNKRVEKSTFSLNVADPHPGSGTFLTPGSRIRDGKNPDPA